MRQRLDRESSTLLGRLRIWRTERSLRELAGAVRGREDLVEGWREDLDRYHKERAGRAGQGTRRQRPADRAAGKREAYRRGLRDAERRGRPTDVAAGSAGDEGSAAGASPAFPPGRPSPEAPSVAREGSSDDPDVGITM